MWQVSSTVPWQGRLAPNEPEDQLESLPAHAAIFQNLSLIGCAGHLAQERPKVQLQQDPAAWLAYEGKWGSTVEAPALQEWFARAEHPVSRSWLVQVN